MQVHDLGPIVSSLSDATIAAQRALNSARLSASAEIEFVKPVHYSLLLRAEVNFSENRESCVGYLRECVRYGKTVVMTCTAFFSYSPFSRSKSSRGDLLDEASKIGEERMEISSETAIRMRGASLL